MALEGEYESFLIEFGHFGLGQSLAEVRRIEEHLAFELHLFDFGQQYFFDLFGHQQSKYIMFVLIIMIGYIDQLDIEELVFKEVSSALKHS